MAAGRGISLEHMYHNRGNFYDWEASTFEYLEVEVGASATSHVSKWSGSGNAHKSL